MVLTLVFVARDISRVAGICPSGAGKARDRRINGGSFEHINIRSSYAGCGSYWGS